MDHLPDTLPIFPISGALLLPRGHLPLNIFEPRYLAMIDAALSTHRLVGIVQPIETDGPLHETGCAGKITSFEETSDGRYIITLTGVSRFRVQNELEQVNGYRRAQPDWKAFETDLNPVGCLDIKREALTALLKEYFDMHNMSCQWEKIEEAKDEQLITCLAMVCPFDPREKQALLEAPCCRARADLFMTLLELAINHKDNAARH